MGVNSLPKTVTRQRRDCDLNPGPSAHDNHSATKPPLCHYRDENSQQNCDAKPLPRKILHIRIKPPQNKTT